ncbi:MAG: DUF2829 domain-containing protein [Flavobacteriales bacterium]
MKNYLVVLMIAFLGNVFMGFSSSQAETGQENRFNTEKVIMKKSTSSNETVGTAVPMKESVRSINNLTFGEAIEKGLKKGKRICRESWNGKDMFVFRQVPSVVPSEVVPKMSSLPESVKKEFARRKDVGWGGLNYNAGIGYKNQLVIVYPDNTIYGWTPSPSDVLEEDWVILS